MFPKVIEAAYNFVEESKLISLFKYVSHIIHLWPATQLQPPILPLGVKKDVLE